jgi:hypothetical protein
MWSWERELGSRETNYRLDVGRFPGKARYISLLQYAAHPAFSTQRVMGALPLGVKR